MQRSVALLLLAALAVACKTPDSGDTDTDASTTSATTGTPPITTVEPTTAQGPTTGEPATSTSTGPDVSGTMGESMTMAQTDTGAMTTTDGGACLPLMCDGGVYACGDCMDNDGDGKVDTADPECVSPCDDREDTFATGLPGDNMDPCKQDCFFDGNSGGGKGDCAWNLACDPQSPGGDKCPYDPNEKNCPDMQSDECIMTCQIPNGCDCFGCCTVEVDGMEYNIYLGDETCSLSDIASCEMCSPNDDCDEECHPEDCEVCFGQDLPDGCDDPTCDIGTPCMIDDNGVSNCPEGEFCSTGCCLPIQPG